MSQSRTWGPLCPEDQGLLIERPEWHARGVAWCPNEAHGGNGRWWRESEVKEGWYDPTRTAAPTEEYLARQAAVAARGEEIARIREERERKTKGRTRMATEAKPAKVKTPLACLCGCGGMTKGGRFIPGHDARFHSRVRALEAQGVSHDEAEKIASKGPLTGKYAQAAAATAKAKAETKPAAAPRTKRPKPVDLTAKASDEPTDTADADAPAGDIEV